MYYCRAFYHSLCCFSVRLFFLLFVFGSYGWSSFLINTIKAVDIAIVFFFSYYSTVHRDLTCDNTT